MWDARADRLGEWEYLVVREWGHTVVLYSAAVAASPIDPVAIVGASGALGFGLAVRLGRAGVPIVIGSREEGRAVEAAARARAAVPEGGFTGAENSKAVETVETVDPERPLS